MRIVLALGISAPSAMHGILGRLEATELLTITRYGRGRTSDLLITATGEAALRH